MQPGEPTLCVKLFDTVLVFSPISTTQAKQGNMSPAPASSLGYTPPDGGWGWAVVLGSFISIGFSYAFPKSLTIFYKEIQEYFSISYSQIAWVSSVMLASMYAGGQCQVQPHCYKQCCTVFKMVGTKVRFSPLCTGPVSSILVNRYGSRPVVMVGGILVSTAMVLASFGTSIIHLYLCIGVIGGKSFFFCFFPH